MRANPITNVRTDNGIAVRALVEQRLQCEITGEKRAFMDQQIDAELANM